MLFTWVITLPKSGDFVPQKSVVKMSNLNENSKIMMKAKSGITLAMVMMVLINAAVFTPRNTNICIDQSKTDANAIPQTDTLEVTSCVTGSVIVVLRAGKK